MWKISAVQLDLARQMESLETIRHFIDFAKKFGFNSIVLYLEGRIRTKSFPWPTHEQSYSSDEMAQIVTYATQQEMDIIPVIATFGHANLFFKHEPMQVLAELREGGVGRLGTNTVDTFCPSVEGTYQFFEKYLTEIAEIFPGSYLHIGCDEVWDIGCCSLCKERIARGETLGDLYVKHIQLMHRIATGKLGKRVMMWDDHLEEMPSVLDAIPSDIIQCVWQYDAVVDQTKTHFGRRRRDHRMADYDRRCISYVICPSAARGVSNVETLTRYGQKFQPLGGILTLWDGDIVHHLYPTIAFTGKRWNHLRTEDGEVLGKQAYKDLFGINEEVFLQALWTVTSLGPMGYAKTPDEFLRGLLTPYASERVNQDRLLAEALKPFIERLPAGFLREILDAILLKLRRELVQFGLQEVVEGLYDGWNGGVDRKDVLLAKGSRLLSELRAIADHRQENWNLQRTGIIENNPGNKDQFARSLHKRMTDFFDSILKGFYHNTNLFVIHYSLPDFYGCPFTHWSVLYEGYSKWETIFRGQPKPMTGDPSDWPFYTIKHPFPAERRIVRARVEVCGYGGLGILYAEVCSGQQILRPLHVEVISGLVDKPDNLLINDTGTCWLGESATAEAFHNPARAQEIHGLEISFAC